MSYVTFVARAVVRLALTAGILIASLAPCWAESAPVIHYAPGENLEHIDVALIDRAEHEIDMAAYVLTDWPVMLALTRAADAALRSASISMAPSLPSANPRRFSMTSPKRLASR
jgi:phosphatidylserine/phosphatidylglycerophosphate/cardiolipin synthase-like enzyme